MQEAPYGATELHRAAIRRARLVANPGCFAYTAILSLAPLVKERLIELDKVRRRRRLGQLRRRRRAVGATHHSEIGNSVFPYNVVDHRHTYEVEQELSGVAGAPVTVHFTPYYVPFTRGILAGCHGFLTRRIAAPICSSSTGPSIAVSRSCACSPSRRIPRRAGSTSRIPASRRVAGSNFVHIGVDVDERRGRAVVFGALDNLGKGAASSAIQNMNCMLGLPEEAGIAGAGLHP